MSTETSDIEKMVQILPAPLDVNDAVSRDILSMGW